MFTRKGKKDPHSHREQRVQNICDMRKCDEVWGE